MSTVHIPGEETNESRAEHADQRPSAPAGPILSSAHELWVPGMLLAGALAFLLAVIDTTVALATVAVFFLGLVPRAKAKSADLLIELQERFSVLAGDQDALNGHSGFFRSNNQKAAYAFYLRFWNLQILEFGLWRFGMLPSDTYAHWIVRRLISFRPENNETYWGHSPRAGWMLVRSEFVGTDFRHFIEAAIAIGETLRILPDEGKHEAQRRTASRQTISVEDYDLLHRRVERLMVRATGTGLLSSFLFRWLNAYRPPLRRHPTDWWAKQAQRRLWRENRVWAGVTACLAFLLLCLAIPAGLFVRPLVAEGFQRLSGRSVTDGTAGQGERTDPVGTVLIGPGNPMPLFVVRFPTEGACRPGGDPRGWRGTTMTSTSRAWVHDIGRDLAACHTADRPVRVEVAGFSSSSPFRDLADCGPAFPTSDAANLALAHARAEGVADALRTELPPASVAVHAWRTVAEMDAERAFVDRAADGLYDTNRGAFNRRVEVRIIAAGACASAAPPAG